MNKRIEDRLVDLAREGRPPSVEMALSIRRAMTDFRTIARVCEDGTGSSSVQKFVQDVLDTVSNYDRKFGVEQTLERN